MYDNGRWGGSLNFLTEEPLEKVTPPMRCIERLLRARSCVPACEKRRSHWVAGLGEVSPGQGLWAAQHLGCGSGNTDYWRGCTRAELRTHTEVTLKTTI